MIEFLSCRPNLEVDDLAPAAAFLREVLGFKVEVDEPEVGLVMLRRDAVGLALVRSATPGVNATTTAYLGVTGVGIRSRAIHRATARNTFVLMPVAPEVLHCGLQARADDANGHACQSRNWSREIGRKRTRSPAQKSVGCSRVASKIVSGVRPIKFHPPGESSEYTPV